MEDYSSCSHKGDESKTLDQRRRGVYFYGYNGGNENQTYHLSNSQEAGGLINEEQTFTHDHFTHKPHKFKKDQRYFIYHDD